MSSTPARFSRPRREVNLLLLEGIHQSAADTLLEAGYQRVERHEGALPEDDILRTVRDKHYLGIRSRTRVTESVLDAAPELRAICCFCIGTNQVDLAAAQARGVPVFNAPFSNTRSVAELVLAEAILLLRDTPRKSAQAHRGRWMKSAAGAFEVRGKNLGIVGYGHIGTQVGLLAEALGMRVFTRNMMDHDAFAKMKPGAAFINASRGTVVDIGALTGALQDGSLCGAAVDVFPEEPKSNQDEFVSPLRGFDNVLLTPHVGGSTQEAQQSIGVEVAEKLIKYDGNGSTVSAVNFPQVSLPPHADNYRLLHIHRNQPGVLASLNAVFSRSGVNISGQYLQTDDQVGYVVIDFEAAEGFNAEQLEELKHIEGTLRARILNP
jgi:D-3-phosphoglycerate dehydrogenase